MTNEFLISGSADKTIRVWNFLEKREKIVFSGQISSVSSIAITRNCRYIIAGVAGSRVMVLKLGILQF